MFGFKVLYCKAKMAAYVNGETPLDVRRRIGRYIDEIPVCYALYRDHLQLQRDLTASLPSFGHPSTTQLDRVWAGIQDELTPRPPSVGYGNNWRWSVASLGLVLMVALPLIFNSATPPYKPTATLNTTQVAVATSVPGILHEAQPEEQTLILTPAPPILAEWVEVTDVAVVELKPAAAITPHQDS